MGWLGLVETGVRTFGPIFVEVVGALLGGEDPVAVLARKRVRDIVPDPLLSELALQARKAADAIRAAEGFKGAATDGGAGLLASGDSITVLRLYSPCAPCSGTGFLPALTSGWQLTQCAACGGTGRAP
jgi:hypothetical protein